MTLTWRTLKGDTFEKKWRHIRKVCEKSKDLSPYAILRGVIIGDPDAFKLDAGGMRPEHAAGPDAKEYELVILLTADHFTTVRPTPRGVPVDRRKFDTFDQAHRDAGKDPRALIYGVCESGRSAVLSRELWQAYTTIVTAIRARDSQQKEGPTPRDGIKVVGRQSG